MSSCKFFFKMRGISLQMQLCSESYKRRWGDAKWSFLLCLPVFRQHRERGRPCERSFARVATVWGGSTEEPGAARTGQEGQRPILDSPWPPLHQQPLRVPNRHVAFSSIAENLFSLKALVYFGQNLIRLSDHRPFFSSKCVIFNLHCGSTVWKWGFCFSCRTHRNIPYQLTAR